MAGHHHHTYHRIEDLPHSSVEALRTAMQLEHVPDNWFNDLAWIMAQESSGRVGVKNSISSARGLYQLTRANYDLMPHGESSFGNAIDEARGGIRYIVRRYHTASHAREFWQSHNWY
jgi:SLT domain-containing protein